MGYGLGWCVELMHGAAIKWNDSTLERQTNHFGRIYTLEWTTITSDIANFRSKQTWESKFASNNGWFTQKLHWFLVK